MRNWESDGSEGESGRLEWSVRAAAEEAVAPRDLLGVNDGDRGRVDAETGDKPGVVVTGLVEVAAQHDLPGDEAAGGDADADQGVVIAAEVGVDGGDGVDAIRDEEVVGRADGAVLGSATFQDLLDVERAIVELGAHDEWAPEGDVLAVVASEGEGLVQVEVDAGLGTEAPDFHLEGARQPTDGVVLEGVGGEVGAFSHGADEGDPGVCVLEALGVGLGAEDEGEIVLLGLG